MDEEERARKAERVKALLQGYYGAEPTNAAGTAGQRGSAASGARGGLAPNSIAVDSPAFDPSQHFANMLKTSSLERLMVEHRNTAKEIKNLDTDMQQLVYENYNKFISATDTIRVMKGELEQAIPDLGKLTTIMDSVAKKSTSISTKLQARQDQMEELHRVQMLLKKLQAVFDLPKRMRAALEEDVLDTAVSFYAEAQPLLRKHGSKGTFKQIAADSDVVAKEISLVLKRRLAERGKDDTEQCVLLLRKLGEPDDTLQDRYLAGRAQRMRRILKDATAVVDAMAAAAVAKQAEAGSAVHTAAQAAVAAARGQLEAAASWGFSDTQEPPGLRAFVRALDEKVINAVQETVMNVMRFFLQQDLSAEAAAAKRKPLVVLAREVFADYFRIVRRALADAIVVAVYDASRMKLSGSSSSEEAQLSTASAALVFGENWGADVLAQALATLSADLGMVSSGLPELGLRDKAAQLIVGAVAHHIDTCFAALRCRVEGAVGVIRDRLAEQQQPGGGGGDAAGSGAALLRRGYAYVVELHNQGLDALLKGLRMYEAHPRLLATCRAEFMHGLQSSLHHLFLDLLSGMLTTCGVRYDGSDLLREALKASAAAAEAATSTASASTGVGAADAGQQDGSSPSSAAWATSQQLASWVPVASNTTSTLAAGAAISSKAGAAAGGGSSGEAARSGLVLLLAKFCTHLEQQSVPWVMEVIAGSFVMLQRGGAAGGGGGVRDPDAPPAFIPGEVARRLSAASSALLAAYVELHGRQLSLMVRRSVAATSWLHHKEPRGPRPVCDLLAERLGRAEAEVLQLVEDAGRRTDTAAAALSGASATARNERGFGAGLLLETGAVERNLAKIFREKVKAFGAPVQFTQTAILGSIACIGLKSLVECIRLQTLGRTGLQQLQLDCHYLRPLLRRYTGGRTQQVVDSLLDEVVTAGVERATDPTLLEPAVLERILDSSS